MKYFLMLVAGVVVAFAIYQQVVPRFPKLDTVIGKMSGAKEDCEGMARRIKYDWTTRAITDPAILRDAETQYRQAAYQFNSCAAVLQTGLQSRFSRGADQTFGATLTGAITCYNQMRASYDRLYGAPMHTQDAPPNLFNDWFQSLLPNIAPAVGKLYDDFMSRQTAERTALLNQIAAVRFHQWEEIPWN